MDLDFSEELKTVGNKFKKAIEDRIDSGVPPPNAPSTIKKKGHGLTLRDTWAYRESIEVQSSSNEVEIGVFDPKIARYVFANEHGTELIPPRPVFGPVVDGPGVEILDDFEEKIADKILEDL